MEDTQPELPAGENMLSFGNQVLWPWPRVEVGFASTKSGENMATSCYIHVCVSVLIGCLGLSQVACRGLACELAYGICDKFSCLRQYWGL